MLPVSPSGNVPPLQVYTETGPTVTTVFATGELDIDTLFVLQMALELAEAGKAETIVLNLAGVGFIDSSGVKTLVEAAKRDAQNRLQIVTSEAVARVIELTGLGDHLPLQATEDAA